METVLLPGLIQEITSFLDDESVANLKQQSTAFNQLLLTEELQGYWKHKAVLEAKLSLPDLPADLDFNWKEFYKVLKLKTTAEAIVAMYPKSQLLSWLILRVNEIHQSLDYYPGLVRSICHRYIYYSSM